MKKRLLASLMALCLLVGLFPTAALAADLPVIDSGYCGSDNTANAQVYSFTDANGDPQQVTYYNNTIWSLTENGVAADGKTTYKLTISGAGPMGDFFSSWSYGRPWLDTVAEQNRIELTATRPYITELEIQEGITEIGERAFAGFTGISTIVLPDTVTDVKDSAFNGCNQVTSIDFSESLVTIEHDGFGFMSSLTSIQLPESLITIGAVAFEGASALSGNLVIPDNVRTIEHGAFANCSNLTGSLTLGTSLETIGDSAFGGCKFTGTLTIPDSIQSIGNGVFNSCEFTKLILGNSLVRIGNNAFSGTFDGKLVIPDHVTDIGDSAFGGKSFTSVRLGSSVVSVGWSAFGNTTTVHSLDLASVPSNISYGESSFQSMANPNTVYVSDSSQIEKVRAALTLPEQRTSFAVTNGGVFPVAAEFEAGDLAIPVRDGYSFMGWYTSDGTENGDWGTEATGSLQAGSTYYAQWEEDNTTDVEIGSVDFGEVIFNEIMPYARTVKLQIPTEEGTSVAVTNVSCNSNAFAVTLDSDTQAVTVAPKDDLNAGEYTGIVCIYTSIKDNEGGETSPTYWFDVSLTVEKRDASISFAETSVSKVITDEPFTVSLSGIADGAEVNYSSSNPNVAVVYNSGLVTIRGVGTTIITATADNTLNYNGSDASFIVTVTDPSAGIPDDDDDSTSGGSDSEPSYSPILDVSGGGEISVNPRTPGEDEDVTITVDPDAGYELDDLTVTDRNGREIDVTANRDGTYTFTQPRGRVTIEVTFVPTGESAFFTDVPETFWAYNEIEWAYDNGYVNGTTATTFNPNGAISRQQVWMILARLSGADPASMAAAQQWAVDNGISDGTTPGGAVTRQQLVALLFRYATLMGYANDARADLSIYPDVDTVASYAVEAMQWSVANNIVAGTTNGTLNPTGTATRAQFAVILYRFWEQIG